MSSVVVPKHIGGGVVAGRGPRNNAIINRLNKTKTEANNQPRELQEARRVRDAEELAEIKQQNKEARERDAAEEHERQAKLEEEIERRREWLDFQQANITVKPKAPKKKGVKKTKKIRDTLPEDEIYNGRFTLFGL